MKKRLVILFVAMAMLVSCFAGCTKKTAVKDGVYTIDWYFVCNEVPKDVESVEAKADEYLKDKIGANLKMHYLTWAQYDEQLNMMNAGGEKYDICWVAGDTYKLNVAKNAYIAINDLMDKYAPKTKEIVGEDFLKGSQIDGKNYGIPANKDKGHSEGILYRKDLAEKYQLTERLNNVKTFDDLYPILDVRKKNEPDIEPLFEAGPASYKDFEFFDFFSFPAGIYLDNPDEVVNYVESPEYKAACEKSRYNLVNKYSLLDSQSSSETHFIEICNLKAGKDKELSATRKYEWVQVELTDRYMTGADTMGSIMAISRTSEQPEKAMQFLELFNTDPYLNNLIVFGIEGKHYNKIDDNTIEPIKNSGYGNAGMQWIFGNTFINYNVKGESPDKVKEMKAFNETLIPAADLGFVFNSENVKTELGACQNVRKEYETRLANGSEDVDKILPEYISKLKSAGSDKIIEEASKQYTEWKKNK